MNAFKGPADMTEINSCAPVRIDFAGGWTDVDAFARSAGGAVVSATINHYVRGRILGRWGSCEDGQADSPLDRSGLEVNYHSELPASTGLGTSAALNVVWLSLIKPEIRSDADRSRLAELAFRLEDMLDIVGGKQDQYAAAYGGFNAMTFGETVSVERLDLAPGTVAELESRLVLCFTGQPRLSSSIHENVWSAFRRGIPETVKALYQLRDCAFGMRESLLAGDIERVGRLLNVNWTCQKALDGCVTTARIDRLFETAFDAGAIGGKACGAGGGGCLILCAAPGRQARVASALLNAGAQVVPFRFEFEGVRVS